MSDFISLGISLSLTEKLRELGIALPTPVQKKAIPIVMEEKDVIVQAQTGTGKTLAFILPILEKVNAEGPHIQALIITPTRELALQITDEIKKLIHHSDGLNVLAVYGGQDVDNQLKKLKQNVQIVVGTPGRLLDHIRRKTVDLSKVSCLVLDEADQMLHIGFLNEVEDIIKETPPPRQTMLFSATMPDEIRKLAGKHLRAPEYIQVEKIQGPAESVKQVAIHTTDRAKQGTLIQLIEAQRPFLAIIFCRTRRRVSKLFEILKSHGFSCDELHGDLSQAKREQVMKRFRDAEIQLLIATDVAARGLDVEGVTHVFNYDIPQDSESYIHRIGRTGRAGMKGIAITLYTSADRSKLDMIEEGLNIRIQKQALERKNKIQEKREPTEKGAKQKQGKTLKQSQKNSKNETINRKQRTGKKEKSLSVFEKKKKAEKSKRTGKPVKKQDRGRNAGQGRKKRK